MISSYNNLRQKYACLCWQEKSVREMDSLKNSSEREAIFTIQKYAGSEAGHNLHI